MVEFPDDKENLTSKDRDESLKSQVPPEQEWEISSNLNRLKLKRKKEEQSNEEKQAKKVRVITRPNSPEFISARNRRWRKNLGKKKNSQAEGIWHDVPINLVETLALPTSEPKGDGGGWPTIATRKPLLEVSGVGAYPDSSSSKRADSKA